MADRDHILPAEVPTLEKGRSKVSDLMNKEQRIADDFPVPLRALNEQ